MGWFISISLYVIWFRDFRPRLGMGWFGRKKYFSYTNTYDFRPRVGMGWFLCRNYLLKKLLQFSSPSGDGLVLKSWTTYALAEKFSSPLGDGLVPYGFAWCWWSENFRPPWEWIGSMLSKSRTPALQSFSSPLGDGLVPYGFYVCLAEPLFSSPSGDGLVLANFL